MKITETNVETLNVKASDLLAIQSVNGPNKTTTLGYYNNKILNVVGTLDQILQVNQSFTSYGLYARPSNVIGCSAEYKEGIGWVGCLGAFQNASEYQTAVPVTSAVGFKQAWVLVNGIAQVVSTGFTLVNSALQTAADGQSVTLPVPVVETFGGKTGFIGSDGDVIYYRDGQAGWMERTLFSVYFGASNGASTTETTIMAAPTGSNLIDGQYTGATANLNKIPPVIRAGYMSNRARQLFGHIMLGVRFGALTSYVTVREYWSGVKVGEWVVRADAYPTTPVAQNLCLELFSYYNNVVLDGVASPPWLMRVHNEWRSGSNTQGFLRMNESFFSSNYPIVDPTIDNPIRLTYQWNEAGNILYLDNFTMKG